VDDEQEDEMKVGGAFPGQYLKSADLQGRRVQVVIDQVTHEDIGGDQKPVAHFKGKDRGLVLNKTNANSIWGICGTDEMDDWSGVAITLFPSKTEYQGKRVDCIRIDPPDVQVAAPARSRPAPPPTEPAQQMDDDEVPF